MSEMFSEPEAVPVSAYEARKAKVTALGRKLNKARVGIEEKHPSALDLMLAVVALDHVSESEKPDFEYNIQVTDTHDGETWIYWASWERDTEWLTGLLERLNELDENEAGCIYKMVKRRKAGKVEEL